MGIQLYDYQIEAVQKMKNGCILNGGVGSGKSRTAVAYFYLQNGGDPDSLFGGKYMPMDDPPKDLYIITTAMKRDKLEWEGEVTPFLISPNSKVSLYPHQKVIIDSWNNIAKYKTVTSAFFIFDEQRVVGSGAWVKSFLRIARHNQWVLLSATPGDNWQDYIPVFIANGFYKNRSEFVNEHVVYSRFTKYPKIDKYINTGRLLKLRRSILIDMDFKRPTIAHHEDIFVGYDAMDYKRISAKRWNIWENKPVENASELCYLLRRVVNSDQARQLKLMELAEKHPRMIIFYNFNYELEILRGLYYGPDFQIAEWNGHKHEPIPKSKSWIYLVQYTAGAEGWNSIKTDTVIFFSQNYSYKIMAQASGRIDRLNTPFKDLYYYHFKSRAPIDIAIGRALSAKKKFNETSFIKW
ncbi:MAG: DEAD/DEAH box helicase family protein [Vallitaleaceae bacterium]|nr:DEAD/DEAH box helicase family protein [Vallitaleaceae bacterium]